MSKPTKERVINVITMQALTGETKVNKVFDEIRNVYTRRDGTLEINYMGGKCRAFRNDKGIVYVIHQWCSGTSYNIKEVLELAKNPPQWSITRDHYGHVIQTCQKCGTSLFVEQPQVCKCK